MHKICIYLRKSRADEEIEKTLGTGETLLKHRKALLKYAKENDLNIVEIKEEIVSGDSLFFRPKMLELLKEIENRKYSGVLVMDIDRLGRGGMKDQGIILDAFKESGTKIITPVKTYDLNNEFDEEMTEFKTFFSRRELKSINRRMQGGRVRSVEEGNYIATNPPFGYDIEYVKKSRTLKINEKESEVVKLIYSLYLKGNGAKSICDHLESLGLKTKAGNSFSAASVIFILKNPVYIGKITWKKKDIRKSMSPGKKKDTKTRDKSEWIVSDGKHKPIIKENAWNKVQNILDNKYHAPYQIINSPVNPFAGILKCGVCKKTLVMRELRGIKRIMCTSGCGNRSVRFDYLEKAIISEIRKKIDNYKIDILVKNDDVNNDFLKVQLKDLKKELSTLKEQKLKLFDFLERGIYSEDVFLDRSNNLNSRISTIESNIINISNTLDTTNSELNEEELVQLENILDLYSKTKDVKKKNSLLKEIIMKVDYYKNLNQKNDSFSIDIYMRLPI